MSTLEVDKIIPQSGTATQLGESGDTITIPAGATITNNGTATGFGSADTEKVKVSANDTTAGFLNGKLVAGTNITLTEGSDGGNETLTAALSTTVTNFTSTGIDDNATSTAMTIDSSENIGIGTTSPASLGSNITTLEITGGSTVRTGAVYLSSSDKNIKGYFYGSNTGFNFGSETNSDLKIVTNNTERVRIHSDGVMSAANGIALGVGTANTASNVLDDYEEGTWTPAYIGGSTAGTGVTGAGQYTKIGNLVHVDFGFVNVTASGAAGDLRISGLPFTVSNATTRGSFGGNVRFYNHQLSGNTYYQLTPVADGNTTYVVVTETRDHGTWTQVQVDNDSGLYIEGGITYVTTS